jgi:exodeoxyribonuclease VII small subunit
MNEPQPSSDDDDAEAPIAGYAAALAELDEILRELEDPDLDVDRLGGQVRRAAQLIAFCRQRIIGARLEVEAVTTGDEPM